MRILIVEDEPDLLRSLAQALREEGYAVDTANNGEDGLFNAESYDYDAIVLDVMLPKLDGWEILKRLRKTKKTPVLMLTARDQTRDRVRGLDTGADDYMVKPFDLPELFARLRALIRRSANKTTNVIEIGKVAIDTAARNVTGRSRGRTDGSRIHAGRVSRFASWRSGHPHATLRTSVRRKRQHAFQPAGRPRFQCPQKTRRGIHHHPPRPRLLH